MRHLAFRSALILLAYAPAVPAAHAGQEVGNGGNVVVCRDANQKITTVELLDYYEARTELGLAIDLEKPPPIWSKPSRTSWRASISSLLCSPRHW